MSLLFVVSLLIIRGGVSFVGFRPILFDSYTPDLYPTLVRGDAQEIEMLAIAFAYQLILSGQFECLDFPSFADCEAAIDAALGKSSHTDLDQVANKLTDLGRTILLRGLALVFHVKGQSMHPWNDMSDLVAKVGSVSFDKFNIKGFLWNNDFNGFGLNFAFAQHVDQVYKCQFPDITPQGISATIPCLALPPSVIAEEYQGQIEHIRIEQPVFEVVAVAYNALTLLDPGKTKKNKFNKTLVHRLSLRLTGKQTVKHKPKAPRNRPQPYGLTLVGRSTDLQKQFHHQGAHIVGIQEARTKGPARRNPDYYYILSGSCSKNTTKTSVIGMEVWVAKKWRSKEGDIYRLRENHIALTHNTSRILDVSIRAPFMQLNVECKHAPSSSITKEQTETWWEGDVIRCGFRNDSHVPVVFWVTLTVMFRLTILDMGKEGLAIIDVESAVIVRALYWHMW